MRHRLEWLVEQGFVRLSDADRFLRRLYLRQRRLNRQGGVRAAVERDLSRMARRVG